MRLGKAAELVETAVPESGSRGTAASGHQTVAFCSFLFFSLLSRCLCRLCR